MGTPKIPVITRLINNSSESLVNNCWLWNKSKDKDGYGKIDVNGSSKRAHRVSYEEFVGKIPEGLYVLHECDNPSCINPDHLFVGNNQDNVTDMVIKGRKVVVLGENHGNSKLTEDQVRDIRELLISGDFTYEIIARMFSVSVACISNIASRRTWKHI